MALHMLDARARPPARRASSTCSTSTSTTIRSRFSAPADALHHHPARPARPAGASAGLRRSRSAPVVSISDSQRRPMPQARLGAHDPSRAAGGPAVAATVERRAILPSSAASRRRKRVDRAIGIAAALRPAAQDRGQDRSAWITSTSSTRSSRSSSLPRRLYRRDRRSPEIRLPGRRHRRCSARSPGPSRSAS